MRTQWCRAEALPCKQPIRVPRGALDEGSPRCPGGCRSTPPSSPPPACRGACVLPYGHPRVRTDMRAPQYEHLNTSSPLRTRTTDVDYGRGLWGVGYGRGLTGASTSWGSVAGWAGL